MANEIKARYSADISQLEIANDKLAAANEKQARQIAAMTAKAAQFNKTQGSSWNAVRARVEEYTRAVKNAANFSEWGDAVEKLKGSQKEFEAINAQVVAVTQSQKASTAQVVSARGSYDSLREAIEKTRKARDAAVTGSGEFSKLDAKLKKLEDGYKRLTASSTAQARASKENAVAARVSGNSMDGLSKQIDYLRERLSKTSKGEEFDRLSQIIAKLQARLKGLQTDASKATESLSKGATASAGSFNRLDYELKKAKEDLKGMTAGTAAFVLQSEKVKRLQGEWDKLDKAINKSGRSIKEASGFSGVLAGQAKSLLATYVGMHQVVSEMTAEWEKQRAFQLDVAQRGKNTDAELVKQAANIGSDKLDAVRRWARENQVDLMAEQKDIINLVGAAISSGANNDSAMKVVASALKLSVGDAEVANEILQGGILVGRLNNSDNYEAAFGQLRSSSKASQAVNENEFIGNTMGKMAALTRGRKNLEGMSTERALEYITAASRIQADRTGDTSSTNMQAIFQRMDEFAPELKKVLKDKSVSIVDQKTIDAFRSAKTFDEKLELLRGNKDLGNQFIDRQRTGGPKELAFALIQNNKAVQDIMRESAAAVLPFKDAAIEFRRATKEIQDAVPNLVVAKKLEAGLEQASTEPKELLMARARATWDSIWNTSPEGKAPVNLSGWDRGIRANEWVNRGVQEGRRKLGLTGGNEVTDMIDSLREIQKGQREAGNKLAVDSLDAQLKTLERIAKSLEELNGRVADGNKQAQPPAQRNVRPPAGKPVPVVPPAAAAAAAK